MNHVEEQNEMSGTIGVTAVEGGYLTIKLYNKEIKKLYVPPPIWEDKYRDSINEVTEYFSDEKGNSYCIEIYSAMGDISYEIHVEEEVDIKSCDDFQKNMNVEYEDIIPKEYTYDEIESGYEKRNRWAKELIEKDFYEISIMMNVSSLETLLKDLFSNNSNFWFEYLDESKINENILSLTQIYQLNKQFLKNLWLEIDDKIKSDLLLELFINNSENNNNLKLTTTLNILQESNSRLSRVTIIDVLYKTVKYNLKNFNFQQKDGTGSFNWLFKKVYNIDIATFLQKEELNGTKLKVYFDEMYLIRHKSTHGIDLEKDVTQKDAEMYYLVTKKVSDFILKEIKYFKERIVKKYEL